jgi:hypothetical protein
MNNVEINEILAKCPNFVGTFSPDDLPRRVAKPEYAMIVNTEANPAVVGHWVSLFARGKTAWYFDSYGQPPSFVPLLNQWCRRRFTRVYYNGRAEQGVSSNVCGAYAIYAVWELCHGTPFRQVVTKFRRIKHDDAFVASWLRRRFGHTIKAERLANSKRNGRPTRFFSRSG